MSDIIHLLPDNIANQIAAGEVIQRPASVVKELVENAVDAGATKIELHIKDAGKTSIQVIDNGKGMSDMDARMSFERHATSKISNANDLFSLKTKGFRGEALASIAAIAHVEMDTKQSDAEIGTVISIAGSKITAQEPSVRSQGTSITVKNLFFNVPARRNFLKSDKVELKHITDEFNRIALTHPEISFIYSHNGSIINHLDSANLRKRIVDLLGAKANAKLVPIEESTDIVNIKGYIIKPEDSKKTRGEQYFFVNNRFFKDGYLHHAVVSGYDNLIAPKHHPSYFIYLEVPMESIDVNVHPTKTEIKFENSKNIYSILRSTVKLALGKYNIAPSLDFDREPLFDLSQEQLGQPIREPKIHVNPNYNPFNTTEEGETAMPSANKIYSNPRRSGGGSGGLSPLQPNKDEWEEFYKITEEEVEEGSDSEKEEDAQLTFDEHVHSQSVSKKMQLHRNLLLVQVKSGLLLIHINRANERLLYDELMESFMLAPISAQQLLFPYEYHFVSDQKTEWENNKKSIERLGFTWEWQENSLSLSSIPSVLDLDHVASCIENIIEKITHTEIDKGEIVHELILALSQAASRSRNKNLTEEEVNHMIDRLFQNEQHQYSPSGKKIMNTVKLEELYKYL